MKLFYDTETTGFPSDKLPPDHRDQSHLVELGAQLWDGDRLLQALSLIINPGDVSMSPGAEAAHGISLERARREGVPPHVAMVAFQRMAELADEVVAHNIGFDNRQIALAEKRLGIAIPLPKLQTCTMQISTPLTKIAGSYRGFKWPKLQEAFQHFFPDEPFEHAHSAYYDCTYCRRIWVALRDGGHLGKRAA